MQGATERAPVSHPRRGTCEPGCERYGYCHCSEDCPARPRLSSRTHLQRGYVTGRPHVFACGHNPRMTPGQWSANGAEVAKVRPLVRWLIHRYGIEGTAGITGVAKGSINTLAYDRGRKRCSPDIAQRITSAVLAHKPAAPRDRFATFDTGTPRPPTQWESERAEKYAEAEYQRLRGSRKYLADEHALDKHTRAKIDRRVYRKWERERKEQEAS